MISEALSTYGNFAPHHYSLKKLGHSPSECSVFSKIAGLFSAMGEAFVSLNSFAEDLHYSKETICRALTSLEKKGRIKKTGQKKYGMFPFVEILPLPLEKCAPKPTPIDAPLIKLSTPIDQTVNDPCPNHQPQENKIKELKKQTAKNVCFENFPKNETLEKKLQSQGMHKHPAKRLISRYPADQIDKKLAQLAYLKSRGDQIQNSAGWLTSALRADFQPTAAQQQSHAEKQEQEENTKQETATKLLREAKYAERDGNLEKAQELAQKSLSHKAFNETKIFLSKLLEQITRNQKLAHAKATIPKTQQDQLLAECLAQQPTHIKSLRLDEKSIKILAEAQWRKRLMELATI